MTEQVYVDDSYLTELTATITAVDGEWLEFDRTIFYPLGGGQPGDLGTLIAQGTSFNILDTVKGNTLNSVIHQLDTADHNLAVGAKVDLKLNWERRYKHMRMHTCMHLLGSLIPVPVTGGSVGAEKSRLDFDLGDHLIEKEDLTERLNQLIQADAPLRFESITDEELDANPDLVRTMSVQPPRGSGVIRMVRIEGVDFQPCGGTHVNKVSEIGAVRIKKIENKGKRNRRVHIVFEGH